MTPVQAPHTTQVLVLSAQQRCTLLQPGQALPGCLQAHKQQQQQQQQSFSSMHSRRDNWTCRTSMAGTEGMRKLTARLD
jgi:hypothetical protein